MEIPRIDPSMFRMEIPKIDPSMFRLEIPKIDPSMLRMEIPRVDPSMFRLESPKIDPSLFQVKMPRINSSFFEMKKVVNSIPSFDNLDFSSLEHDLGETFVKESTKDEPYNVVSNKIFVFILLLPYAFFYYGNSINWDLTSAWGDVLFACLLHMAGEVKKDYMKKSEE
ncbi:hypothetical protein [Halobacillus sp. Marseille-P3879]|uniref:hypothetical protein n=1 Tax=Halobacillus sp. Marseille-P3879 TaxID=2045014 RepID=UPI0011AEDF36|nr:hypothetical protein [Halobacillus sp. Marseille-P3879]